MEKRILGLILSLLGIGGLVYAGIVFLNDTTNVKSILFGGILGGIFFFAGIGLVKRTRDKPS